MEDDGTSIEGDKMGETVISIASALKLFFFFVRIFEIRLEDDRCHELLGFSRNMEKSDISILSGYCLLRFVF